jgi:hypothetical protein
MAGIIDFEAEKYEIQGDDEELDDFQGVDDEVDGLTLNGKHAKIAKQNTSLSHHHIKQQQIT